MIDVCQLLCLTVNVFYVCFIHLQPDPNPSSVAVGVTNSDPIMVSPTQYNYVMCSTISNEPGSTIGVQCPPGMPPSRYLIVNKLAIGAMTICELEVYAQGEHCHSIK